KRPKKYEAGEGYLTPLGATPHPHRSLALCRFLPPVKVPTQAGRTSRTPNIPHAGSVPRNHGKKKLRLEFSPAQTMAKKSLAEIFLYPKRRAYVARMTLEWLGFESLTRTRCALRDPQIRHAGPMASPRDGDGLSVMP